MNAASERRVESFVEKMATNHPEVQCEMNAIYVHDSQSTTSPRFTYHGCDICHKGSSQTTDDSSFSQCHLCYVRMLNEKKTKRNNVYSGVPPLAEKMKTKIILHSHHPQR